MAVKRWKNDNIYGYLESILQSQIQSPFTDGLCVLKQKPFDMEMRDIKMNMKYN